MKVYTPLVIAGMSLAFVSGAARATEVKVSYNYTANLGVYPSDDPPTGNQYTTTGSVSQIVDIDPGYFQITTPTSILFDYPGQFQELTAIDTADDFSFAVNISLPSDLTAYGTYNFSADLSDAVNDPSAFNGGGVYIPGSIGYDDPDGFSKNPTFSVTGSVTFAQVSGVPLPASAPLFGVALVALGAAGYGLKRKSKAPAQA